MASEGLVVRSLEGTRDTNFGDCRADIIFICFRTVTGHERGVQIPKEHREQQIKRTGHEVTLRDPIALQQTIYKSLSHRRSPLDTAMTSTSV